MHSYEFPARLRVSGESRSAALAAAQTLVAELGAHAGVSLSLRGAAPEEEERRAANRARAGRAERALAAVPEAYARNEEGVSDLLSDTLHLATALGLDAERLLDRAGRNYRAEVAER